MRYVVRVAVVVGLVLSLMVGSAFAFADFGVAESATNVESAVSTAYANETNLDLSRGLYPRRR